MYRYEVRIEPDNETLFNSFLCFYAHDDDEANDIINTVCETMQSVADQEHDTGYTYRTICKIES